MTSSYLQKSCDVFGYREKLEAFLVHAMEGGLISDGAIAQDINQASAFWYIREVGFVYQTENCEVHGYLLWCFSFMS